MAGTNNVPERLIAFRVYGEGNDLLGTANVTLPTIEPMTGSVRIAVSGEVIPGAAQRGCPFLFVM